MRPSVEFAVLSDDFRLEQGNKVSLIGLYGNHLFLSNKTLPTLIWKICYFQRWKSIEKTLDVEIELQGPSGQANQPPLKLTLNPPPHPDDYRQLAVSIEPLPILEFGQYHLKTYSASDHELLHDFSFFVKPNPELESTQLPLELTKQ